MSYEYVLENQLYLVQYLTRKYFLVSSVAQESVVDNWHDDAEGNGEKRLLDGGRSRTRDGARCLAEPLLPGAFSSCAPLDDDDDELVQTITAGLAELRIREVSTVNSPTTLFCQP